ncbi:MAG: hypothetical protein GTO13_11770 [Proteobacteria bacterium]|nr:hypothetical protein [Pseudomonadota bacterium]
MMIRAAYWPSSGASGKKADAIIHFEIDFHKDFSVIAAMDERGYVSAKARDRNEQKACGTWCYGIE